jgi:signal transduction histidine kinase/ActR/RegA family two-component response regulator
MLHSDAVTSPHAEELRLVLDDARVCAWAWDIASDRITSWGSAEQLPDLGEAPRSLRACLELVHPEDRAAVNAALSGTVEHGAPIDIEFRIRRADGESCWFLARGHVERDAAGVPVRLLGVALDIDGHKRADEERAHEATRIKDEFLAMVSHELRGPLQTTIMWAHVLRKDDIDAATRLRALAGIQQSAELQRRLVDDLVDVSRIVAGKLALRFQPVEPAAVVESVVDIIRPGAESKGLRLDVELDRASGRVAGDPDRLQQVVWNLVSNAVKFTPAGGLVAVRARRVGRQLEIVVSDTGDGIVPELLSHVFEPFRQADALGGGSRAGLGLGLTIVRHLVERHGGTVRAESPGIGRGATFTVTLPVDEAVGEDCERSVAADPAELDGVRVLLVDDEAPEREALSSVLERYHAHVTAVASAAEAIAAIDRAPVDVLVFDIAMPGEDGYALIRKVRARGPQHGGGIPAAAITALAGEENRALREGFQVYLPKPVSPARLAATVRSLSGSPHDVRSR